MVTHDDGGGWFGYVRTDDEPEGDPPVAEVVVRVFRLERGGSGLQLKTEVPDGFTRRAWYEAVTEAAIDAMREIPEVFASHDE